MCKFIAPEVLQRFGGAQAYAQAISACLDTLAGMLAEPAQLRRLLFPTEKQIILFHAERTQTGKRVICRAV